MNSKRIQLEEKKRSLNHLRIIEFPKKPEMSFPFEYGWTELKKFVWVSSIVEIKPQKDLLGCCLSQ